MNTRKQLEYKDQVIPQLKKQFGYTNDLAVPKLLKIVVNRGINAEESKSGNIIDDMAQDLALLTGQKPVIRKAKKSIATFKIRDGMPNGISVTIRRDRMYALLDRYVTIATPRIRDFRGITAQGDGHGNFTIGVPDQRIFPELETRTNKGFNITFVTSAETDAEGKALLLALGMPFRI